MLAHKWAEQKVYRRHHVKADGRNLFLYGYQPYTLPLMPETADDLVHGGEMRWHPLRQEWNLYAAHRQNRTYKPSTADDPLAPSVGGQAATEIPFSDFELAVFENKFASLHPDAIIPRQVAGVEKKPSIGRCEVVVYGPDARGDLAAIGQDRRRLLVSAWLDRYDAHFAAGRKFILPFENRGEEVGVTLHHPHGQIYAFDFIPQVQTNAAASFAKGYDLRTDMRDWGAAYRIAEAGGIAAFCPIYARFPFEVWLAPLERRPGLWAFTAEELDGFAHLLGEITQRYDMHFQRATPYMLALQAAPLGAEKNFHFTAQFQPLLRAADRIKYLASVEQSTGTFTIDVMPENAAQLLRECL